MTPKTMGLNVDLTRMLGVPKYLTCPRCLASVNSGFDDYDIDGDDGNPNPGMWELNCYCPECEKDFVAKYRIEPHMQCVYGV